MTFHRKSANIRKSGSPKWPRAFDKVIPKHSDRLLIGRKRRIIGWRLSFSMRQSMAVLPSSGSLRCDYLEFRSSENVVYARGHVVLISSSAHIEADDVKLDLSLRRALASGHVYLEDGKT